MYCYSQPYDRICLVSIFSLNFNISHYCASREFYVRLYQHPVFFAICTPLRDRLPLPLTATGTRDLKGLLNWLLYTLN